MAACMRCGSDSPPEARFCMACGFELARQAPRRTLRKTVTVVFTDLVGSTDVGERLDPEALREVLADYFARMRAVIEHHGGLVERLLGDAVLAVFGLPTAHEDDALRAVRAAVDMRAALAEVNEGLPAGLDLRIRARTGINTGEVLVADDALTGVMTGDVVGDVVNVAARLEAAADTDGILIGELTHRLVRDYVESEPLTLRLKGKRDDVRAHRVLSVSDTRALGRRLSAPLIGRQQEYDALLAAFATARGDGVGQLVTVLGAAGSGKSRLVRDVTAALAVEAKVVSGRCLPYGEIAMLPVAEVVTQLVGLGLDTTGAAVQHAVARALEDEPDDATLIRAARIAGAAGLGPLAGAVEDAALDLAALLVASARDQPVVVVIEDLHWASESLLDLLEAVARGTTAAVLLLCTSRPDVLETHPTWSATIADAAVVDVPLLDSDHSRLLISELLGAGDAARDVTPSVVAVAEGNPLVVEEALAMLIDDGLLVRRDGAWRLETDIGDLRIPPTVDAILAARLDLLPPDERRAAELAAVVGKEFSRAELGALNAGEVPDLDATLDALWAKQLIDLEDQQPDGLRFHHILVRDAVYAATPKRRRADLHGTYADIVGAMVGGELGGQFSEIVGEHLERSFFLRRELGAGKDALRPLGSRAAQRLVDAGERATGSSDHGAAERLLTRALALLDEAHPLRASLLMDLSEVLHDMAQQAAARDTLERAIAATGSGAAEDVQLRAELARIRSDVLYSDREATSAVSLMRDLAERLEEIADGRVVVRAWTTAAHVAYSADKHDIGVDMMRRAVEHARRTGGAELPYCLVGLCEVALWGSLPALALRDMCSAAISEAQAGTLHAAALEMKLGMVDGLLGDFELAGARLTNALNFAESHRAQVWVSDAHWKLGGCAVLAGDFEAAAAHLGRTRALFHDFGEPSEAAVAAQQAVCFLRLGDVEQARAGTDFAMAHQVDSETRIAARVASAELEILVGDPVVGVARARDAVEVAEVGDDILALGDSLSVLGRALLATGGRHEAVSTFERALAVYEAKGVVPAVAATRELLAQMSAFPA
ncbi:AAA family ATPase [Nocardioides humilatus]|uniref:AAA family ATPase n=1 Tax=Nocardioides humilatus TaxID=2607660 RepID=A0A5B1LFW7_9ACTN|nr:adenylate/guanylate cyclase domain-containing protein [Nocardioides humilatus]KAA1418569.1 AAA family ATPase [Nocardioides humilatus]